MCGGIEEVKIGMDVADVRECHEQKDKKEEEEANAGARAACRGKR